MPDPKKKWPHFARASNGQVWFFLLHWLIYVSKTIHTSFYENRITGTRFFRHINFLHFWLLGDSTMGGLLPHFSDFRFFTVNFALSWLQKCFKAYVSPISTIICRKNTKNINLKIAFSSISTNSTMEGVYYRTFGRLVWALPERIFDQFFH